MIYLSIDPGEKAGYAVFEGKPKTFILVGSGSCDGTLKNVNRVYELIKSTSPHVLFVESQFIHGKRKTKGIITLIERAGMWHTMGKFFGLETYRVDPSNWFQYWDLQTDKTIENKAERYKRFQQSIVEEAQEVTGKKVQQNEADAILIGFYCLEMGEGYW